MQAHKTVFYRTFQVMCTGIGYTLLNFCCLSIGRADDFRVEFEDSKSLIRHWLISCDINLPSIIRFVLILMLNITYVVILCDIISSRNQKIYIVLWISSNIYLLRIFHSAKTVPIIESFILLGLIISKFLIEQFMHRAVKLHVSTFAIIFVNCYSGLYIARSESSISELISLVILIQCMMSLNFIQDDNRKIEQWSRGTIFLTVIFVLGRAYFEYHNAESEVSFAPIGQPWRSVYFSLVLSTYILVPLLWKINNSRILSLSINALCMAIIPILFCFTPHGILLLLFSSIWIAMTFVFGSLLLRHRLEKFISSSTFIILMCFALLIILLMDRFFYCSLLSMLAPTFPLASGVATATAASGILALVFSQPTKIFQYLRKAWDRHGDIVTIWNLIVLGISTICIISYLIMHLMFQYSNNLLSTEKINIVRFPVKGFSGLNSWSWACLSYFIYCLMVSFNELYHWIPYLWNQRSDRY